MLGKRMFICLMFLGLVLPGLASAAAPPNQTGFSPKTDVDTWIDGWGWHHWWWTGLDTSDTIYVEIEVTSGGDIDFFICDQENWDLWESGYTASVYQKTENAGSISKSFRIPNAGTWHVVFQNDALLTRKHIEGYIGLSPLYSTVGVDLSLVVIVFAAIFIVGVVYEGLKRIQRPKVEGYPPHLLPQQPQMIPTHPPAKPQTNFCPYCGTPRQSKDSHFCAKCGRAFDEPSLG
ncbi:MAG: zinc ribbon domain-containing protein [Promethearchaeota archaeon]